jgi:uncharacterized protein involved in exopolysaccharide biosynthesis
MLYDYWQDIYERKFLILLVAISAAGFAYLISLVLPPLYEVKVTFYSPANLNLPTYTRSDAVSRVPQAPFLPTPDEKAAAVNIGILLSQDVYRTLHERYPQRPVDKLRKNVDINVSDQFMVDIHVRDPDPELAAAIANELPKLYREFHVRALRERLTTVVETLTRQLEQRDVEIVQSLKDEFTRNLVEAKLQLQDPPVAVVVVQNGVPPTRPVFPLPILNAVVAGLTGTAAGCYYTLLLGYLARLKKARIRREMDWSPFLDGRLADFLKARSSMGTSEVTER